MSVTFYATELRDVQFQGETRPCWDFIDGTPELNVSNSNAVALLWSCFDVKPGDGLCGDMGITEAIRKLAFWMKHGGPRALTTPGWESHNPGEPHIICGGRTLEQTQRYATKLHEILTFASLHEGDDIRLGWG